MERYNNAYIFNEIELKVTKYYWFVITVSFYFRNPCARKVDQCVFVGEIDTQDYDIRFWISIIITLFVIFEC